MCVYDGQGTCIYMNVYNDAQAMSMKWSETVKISEDHWSVYVCMRKNIDMQLPVNIFSSEQYIYRGGIPQNYPEQDNPVSFEKIGVTIYSL